MVVISEGLQVVKAGTQAMKLIQKIGAGMKALQTATLAASAMKQLAGVNVTAGSIASNFTDSDSPAEILKQLNLYLSETKSGLTANEIDGTISVTVSDADGKNVESAGQSVAGIFDAEATADITENAAAGELTAARKAEVEAGAEKFVDSKEVLEASNAFQAAEGQEAKEAALSVLEAAIKNAGDSKTIAAVLGADNALSMEEANVFSA